MKLCTEIEELLARQHGTLTSGDLAKLGVSRTMVGKYVAAGLLEHVERGVYTRPGEIADEMFVLAKRCGRLVFSHGSALFVLGMSERMPFRHAVSLRSSVTLPNRIRECVDCFYVKDALFEIGLTSANTQFGNAVPCFDLERTICDLVRDRTRLGEEDFLSAIKRYAASPARNLAKLGEYAIRMGIEGRVNATMEMLV